MCTCSGACCCRDRTSRTTPIPSGPRSTRSPSTQSSASPPVHRSPSSSRPACIRLWRRAARCPCTSLTTEMLPMGTSLQSPPRLPSTRPGCAGGARERCRRSSSSQPPQSLQHYLTLGGRPHGGQRGAKEPAVAGGDQPRVEDRHHSPVRGG